MMKTLLSLTMTLLLAGSMGCREEPTTGDRIRDIGDGIGDAVDEVHDEIEDAKN